MIITIPRLSMVEMANGVRTASDVVTLPSPQGLGPLQVLDSDKMSRRIFLEPMLGTCRNTLTVPLVWYWHPKSNLDPTRSWHYRWDGRFATPAKARSLLYAGVIGIKRLTQSYNSKILVGIEPPTLRLGALYMYLSYCTK